MNSSTDALRRWHDQLGAMIDQVGHPDYSLRELVDGMRLMRDNMLALLSAQGEQPSSEPVPCSACGGGGQVEIGRHPVTRAMALDAGEPAMEGMDGGPEYGRCPECGGSGQVASPQPQGEQYRAGLEKKVVELQRIRALCIKALVRATGYSRDAIEDAPLTCAIKHADEVEAIRAHVASLKEEGKL